MPKPKTKKSVTKRFKVTKNGKVLRMKAGRGHLLSKKSSKKRRKLRKKAVCCPQDAIKIKRMLGGGS